MGSPVTGGKTRLLRTLTGADVCAVYKQQLAFDVAPYIDSAAAIELHECLDTGYQFYTPVDQVEGPPEFYDKLYSTVGKDWGYAEGKWEHHFALGYCQPGDRVLDIGCGGGAFLDLARNVAEVAGLESSNYGQESCRKLGLTVSNETIGQHAAKKPHAYDVVCAFQVLEHASNVREFVESCIRAVRSGGTIVLSVPNNEGFVGAQDLPLNMPPHHVGRWGPKSLRALPKHFDLDLIGMHYEPLGNNADWFKSWLERTYFTRNRLMRALWYKLGFSKALGSFLHEHAHTIHGHTVMAVYRRR